MYKDFTIQDGGFIFYRETAAKSDLDLYRERIQVKTSMDVVVKRAIVITYVNMQEVAVESSRYSFQVILTDTEAGFYGIVNYFRVSSDKGGTSGFYDAACRTPSYGKLLVPKIAEVKGTKCVQVFRVKPCDLLSGAVIQLSSTKTPNKFPTYYKLILRLLMVMDEHFS